MAVEKVCPLHAKQMKVWLELGGANSGVIGNKAHKYGFHRGAAFVSASDYSRRRDPNGADGPFPDWGWCCAGDYRHGGKPVLRARHLVLLTRLLDDDPTLRDVCEFIGQPWAGRPVMYWARWEGVRNLRRYKGQGHDLWSHVSVFRSRAGGDAPLWTPASANVQPGKPESGVKPAAGKPVPQPAKKPAVMRAPEWPKGVASYRASSKPKYAAAVRAWQARMIQRGWKVKADGYYGPTSERVCRAFQREKKLTVDGLLGPKTFALAWSAPLRGVTG